MVAKPDLKIIDPGATQRAQLLIHERYRLTPEGSFLMDMVKMASHSAIDAGETSSGEQKMRLLTPEEAVGRAMQVTQMMFAAMQHEGWVLDIPSWDEISSASPNKTGF